MPGSGANGVRGTARVIAFPFHAGGGTGATDLSVVGKKRNGSAPDRRCRRFPSLLLMVFRFTTSTGTPIRRQAAEHMIATMVIIRGEVGIERRARRSFPLPLHTSCET